MSSDLETYREALAEALDSIDGLRCSDRGYWPDQINPPQAWFDLDTTYDLTFAEGAHGYTFWVRVLVSRAAVQSAQIFLDQLRDPRHESSVRQVVPDHAAVVAACQYTRVMQGSTLSEVTVGDAAKFMQVEFELEVVI